MNNESSICYAHPLKWLPCTLFPNHSCFAGVIGFSISLVTVGSVSLNSLLPHCTFFKYEASDIGNHGSHTKVCLYSLKDDSGLS